MARDKLREENILKIEQLLRSLLAPPRTRPPQIDAELLHDLGISLSPMPFYADDVLDFDLNFCKPFPAEGFDKLFNEIADRPGRLRSWFKYPHPWHTHPHSTTEDYVFLLQMYLSSSPDDESECLMYGSDWQMSDIRFGRGGDIINLSDCGWSTNNIFDIESLELPHTSCLLSDWQPIDGRVLRSELIVAANLIRIRMTHYERKANCIFPVFLYTVSNHFVRVSQAYFDGQILQMRQTEIIDLGTGDMAPVKMLLRWMMNKPIVYTKWEGEEDEPPKDNTVPSTLKKLAVSA